MTFLLALSSEITNIIHYFSNSGLSIRGSGYSTCCAPFFCPASYILIITSDVFYTGKKITRTIVRQYPGAPVGIRGSGFGVSGSGFGIYVYISLFIYILHPAAARSGPEKPEYFYYFLVFFSAFCLR